ncbi:HlyD family secretion protein [Alkalinema pantanalense CENA528]|uniref:HlyD family secretion protein n=1 Tax=Alkalinema pantanalense TaxID=1620705 RepID=UPI003D6DFE43
MNSQSQISQHSSDSPLPPTEAMPWAKDEMQSVQSPIVAEPLAPDSQVTDPDPNLSPKGNSKKILWWTIGAIVLTIGGAFGWQFWHFQRTHVTTENAQIQGHLSPISSQIPATVKQVLVKNGDRVEVGQPMIILEDPDLNLKVQQAEANLAIAEAQLQAAQDNVSLTSQTKPTQLQQSQAKLAANQSAIEAAQAAVLQAQAAVETNQANVDRARTEVNRTRLDWQRYQQLANEGAIPTQQLDTAKAAYDSAQANQAALQKMVASAQAQVASAQAQLQKAEAEAAAAQGQVAETQVSTQTVKVQQDQQQLAQAQVKQAKAALDLARQQIKYMVIKAPVSGTVGQLMAQVGQKAQVGQPLLSVVPLQASEVYVDANFKETALGKLHIGDKAEVEVDAYPGQTFSATIEGINPATGSSFALIPPDNATGNFNKVVQWVPVRLTFDDNGDAQGKLKPGLSVKVTVDTSSDDR